MDGWIAGWDTRGGGCEVLDVPLPSSMPWDECSALSLQHTVLSKGHLVPPICIQRWTAVSQNFFLIKCNFWIWYQMWHKTIGSGRKARDGSDPDIGTFILKMEGKERMRMAVYFAGQTPNSRSGLSFLSSFNFRIYLCSLFVGWTSQGQSGWLWDQWWWRLWSK